MRFAKADIRLDTKRVLARCGATVAPSRDLRWRYIKDRQIDSVEARRVRRGKV